MSGEARFVLASTGTVYEPYGGRLAEDAPVAPVSFYSATKLAAEALLQGWRSRLGCCALRLFFPYGPGQTGRLVPQLVERIRAKTAVTLDGSGDGMVLARPSSTTSPWCSKRRWRANGTVFSTSPRRTR